MRVGAALVMGLALAACAGGSGPEARGVPEPDPAREPRAEGADPDPWEAFNRPVFALNDRILDRAFLEPVAVGWSFLTLGEMRLRIDQLFANTRFPIRFVNALLQAEPRQAATETGRFVVNTTVGLAGLFDPATGLGLEMREKDFGQTFGRWGIPPGPYLMLPLWGPSSPRDALGGLLDRAPYALIPYYFIASSVELVNGRALVLEDVRDLRAGSLDYYTAVRDGWVQRRRALVEGGREEPPPPPDDLYEVPGDED